MCTVHCVYCALCVLCTVCTVYTVYTVSCIVYSVQCTVCPVFFSGPRKKGSGTAGPAEQIRVREVSDALHCTALHCTVHFHVQEGPEEACGRALQPGGEGQAGGGRQEAGGRQARGTGKCFVFFATQSQFLIRTDSENIIFALFSLCLRRPFPMQLQ